MHSMTAFKPPLLEPLECPIDDVARVPRRFGVGVLLILMTAFAVLFAVMRTFHAPPELFLVVAGLFLAVTLGQILLFQGKKPRAASLLAGGVVFPLEIVALIVWQVYSSRDRGPDPMLFMSLVPGLMCSIPGGIGLGYLAGCFMAGVFLIQERLARRNIVRLQISLAPLTEADFDMLCNWVHYRPLFNLWSQEQFGYPLDHDQLRDRYGGANSTPSVPDPLVADLLPANGCPAGRDEVVAAKAGAVSDAALPREQRQRIAYKAVGGEMRQMVAMVELARIDRRHSRASIELAIVDPSRDDRGHLSRELVREIVREAFERQGLGFLQVILHHSAVESAECFRQQGFFDVGRSTEAAGEYYEYVSLLCSKRYCRPAPRS